MTIEFLIKASKIIEAGLRAHAKPEEAPCPWSCPVACGNCKKVDCEDRLAGGQDE